MVFLWGARMERGRGGRGVDGVMDASDTADEEWKVGAGYELLL